MAASKTYFCTLIVLVIVSTIWLTYLIMDLNIPAFQQAVSKTNPHSENSTTASGNSQQAKTSGNSLSILVDDGRRTGNQMFNFAVMICTAWRNGMTPVLYPQFQLQKVFMLNVSTAHSIHTVRKEYKALNQKGRMGQYDSRVEHIRSLEGYAAGNIALRGWFQSWKYMKGYERRLRKHLQFHPQTKNGAIKYFKSLFPELLYTEWLTPELYVPNVTLVGVHVRRGDLFSPHLVRHGFTVPDVTYFKKAMAYFAEKFNNVHFVVCSDNINWCKKELVNFHPHIHFSEGHDLAMDLAILSMCQHTLMSTGTYGWWAAWLANGTTVYYNGWPKKNSKLEADLKRDDFFMPGWISMD